MAVFDLPGQQVAVPKIQLRASASVAYSRKSASCCTKKAKTWPCTSAATIAFFFCAPTRRSSIFHQSRGLFFFNTTCAVVNTRADVLKPGTHKFCVRCTTVNVVAWPVSLFFCVWTLEMPQVSETDLFSSEPAGLEAVRASRPSAGRTRERSQ